MTEEEKRELQKLDKEDLIDMLDSLRTDAEKQRAADKKEVIDRFLGRKSQIVEEDDENDLFDIRKNAAYARLSKKFS